MTARPPGKRTTRATNLTLTWDVAERPPCPGCERAPARKGFSKPHLLPPPTGPAITAWQTVQSEPLQLWTITADALHGGDRELFTYGGPPRTNLDQRQIKTTDAAGFQPTAHHPSESFRHQNLSYDPLGSVRPWAIHMHRTRLAPPRRRIQRTIQKIVNEDLLSRSERRAIPRRSSSINNYPQTDGHQVLNFDGTPPDTQANDHSSMRGRRSSPGRHRLSREPRGDGDDAYDGAGNRKQIGAGNFVYDAVAAS